MAKKNKMVKKVEQEPVTVEAVEVPAEDSIVPGSLAALGRIYEERNRKYGKNYHLHGFVMMGLFPHGVNLASVSDFNRYSCLKEMATRLGRYSHNFHDGGHTDSLDDIAVYSQMLRELDGDEQ